MAPYLTVKDADRSLDFYARAFGFAKRSAMSGPDGRTGHAEMTYRGVLLMFSPEGAWGQRSPEHLFVSCEDVDALFARARAAGAAVAKAPQDMFWGDRMCSLIDPDGHVWNFASQTDKTTDPKRAEE
jgi:uncharacterized glyoxalase superfamily protein PhnB